jgi:UDP-GlcNAc:undecaprenyl-phosphate GlcNAc-1-phosphate transferase
MLGFALAGLGLAGSWKVAGTTVATLILPILVLAVPILDTGLVTVVRLLEGRPIYQGGRDHSSHRLVRFGLSEKNAVALLALVATGLGLTSLAYNVLDNERLTLVGVLITFVLLVQFASFLADVERRPSPDGAPGLLQTFAVHWRRLVEVVVDFGLISLAFLAAYAIQFGWPGTVNQRHIATVTLPIVLGYISTTQSLGDFSRTFFVVDALLCAAIIAASRLAERALVLSREAVRDRAGRRSLIVGAGRTGRSLMRELRETAGERVVGFVDDNPRLRRRRVHGAPVLGSLEELPRILERAEASIVLVTIPDAPRERLDAIVAACAEAGVTCQFVRREIDLDPRVVLGSTAE